MRLIDADELLKKMNLAIAVMKRTMKAFGIEDDAEAQMELKAYEDIRNGINDEPTVNPEPHWIPFEVRELTDKERKEHPDWEWILDGDIPEDGQEILISRGNWVTTDTFIDEGECYLDGGWEIEEGMAWMPLPEPYKEEGGKE